MDSAIRRRMDVAKRIADDPRTDPGTRAAAQNRYEAMVAKHGDPYAKASSGPHTGGYANRENFGGGFNPFGGAGPEFVWPHSMDGSAPPEHWKSEHPNFKRKTRERERAEREEAMRAGKGNAYNSDSADSGWGRGYDYGADERAKAWDQGRAAADQVYGRHSPGGRKEFEAAFLEMIAEMARKRRDDDIMGALERGRKCGRALIWLRDHLACDIDIVAGAPYMIMKGGTAIGGPFSQQGVINFAHIQGWDGK
jgi:hypothetical protein